MILPDFVLRSRINQQWHNSGMDCLEHCFDPKHYESFPYDVSYCYNSRGFRDSEWPDNVADLAACIWCLGDSFTVGLGSPLEHTWPNVLQQRTGTRVINVSMDGASNNWLARKSLRILEEIQPKHLIIQWSYISRREIPPEQHRESLWQNHYNNIKDPIWPACTWKEIHTLPQAIIDELGQVHKRWDPDCVFDEDLRIYALNCDDQEDVDNTLRCIDMVNQSQGHTQIIHSFIPQFVPAYLKGTIESQIAGPVVPEIEILDLARDGKHYDIQTSQAFVQQLMQFLNGPVST
jgi:hypothetical protein